MREREREKDRLLSSTLLGGVTYDPSVCCALFVLSVLALILPLDLLFLASLNIENTFR